MRTLICSAATAILLLVGCEAALPQTKPSPETPEQKRVARVKAALLHPDGHDIGGNGLSLTVSAGGLNVRIRRREFDQACSSSGAYALWGYIDANDLAAILDVYMTELRKRQQQDAQTVEHLAKIIGVNGAKPDVRDAAAGALPMSLMPKKALVISR
jgi:hypothetical protein